MRTIWTNVIVRASTADLFPLDKDPPRDGCIEPCYMYLSELSAFESLDYERHSRYAYLWHAHCTPEHIDKLILLRMKASLMLPEPTEHVPRRVCMGENVCATVTLCSRSMDATLLLIFDSASRNWLTFNTDWFVWGWRGSLLWENLEIWGFLATDQPSIELSNRAKSVEVNSLIIQSWTRTFLEQSRPKGSMWASNRAVESTDDLLIEWDLEHSNHLTPRCLWGRIDGLLSLYLWPNLAFCIAHPVLPRRNTEIWKRARAKKKGWRGSWPKKRREFVMTRNFSCLHQREELLAEDAIFTLCHSLSLSFGEAGSATCSCKIMFHMPTIGGFGTERIIVSTPSLSCSFSLWASLSRVHRRVFPHGETVPASS